MRVMEGGRTLEMRRGRERLTAHNPRIETALASLDIDPDNVAETRLFGNRLQAAADRWMLGTRSAQPRQITKRDAAFLLGQALRNLAE